MKKEITINQPQFNNLSSSHLLDSTAVLSTNHVIYSYTSFLHPTPKHIKLTSPITKLK